MGEKLAAAICGGEMLCERLGPPRPKGLKKEEVLAVALGVRPLVRFPVDVLPLLVDIRDQRRENPLCL